MPTVHYVSREVLGRELGIRISRDESYPDLASILRRHASSIADSSSRSAVGGAAGDDDGIISSSRRLDEVSRVKGEESESASTIVDGSTMAATAAVTAGGGPSTVARKRKPRKRMPSIVLESSNAPPGLPEGWKSRTYGRRGKTNANRRTDTYTYYYSPINGIHFRSTKKCQIFIDIMEELQGADEMAALVEFKARGHKA
jgi:hypothetical protein